MGLKKRKPKERRRKGIKGLVCRDARTNRKGKNEKLFYFEFI